MFVTLFRHAERDRSSGLSLGLSRRGEQQAMKLISLVENGALPRPEKALTSPLSRAQATLRPLANHLDIPLQELVDLNERQAAENREAFIQRIRRAIATLSGGRGQVFACTHLDWLEEAMMLIPCDTDLTRSEFYLWPPGQFMHFEIIENLWHLRHKGELIL